MPQFFLIGSRLELPEQGVVANRFGDALDLDQQSGEAMARNGVPILPADRWRSLGITAEELRRYESPALWDTPEAQPFVLKRSSAFLAFAEYTESLQTEEEVSNG